jgi:choline dehydrogenase-like flavoprotein
MAGADPRLAVDVVVYGGTSAGVIAAYTAKRYGKSVLLVEPGRHLGGMSSGGLGATDIGNKHAITGLGPRLLPPRASRSRARRFALSPWYPEADYTRRVGIWKEHEAYQKGLLHFIATDSRVPEPIRKEMQSWGYCRDEFLDSGGWPHQLYVREARRLVGEYVMTEHNARGTVTVGDGIGMAAYGMDSHNVQRAVVNGMVKNEGNVEVGIPHPYPISLAPRGSKTRPSVGHVLKPDGDAR